MVEIRRILCPIDFSPFSIKAYAYAQSLARHYGAKLYVQHLVELWNDASMSVPPTSVFEEFRRVCLQEGEARLERFVESRPYDGLPPERHVQEGMPADRILALAKEQEVDMVVMGTHGRRGLNRLMLGSVTERVLRNATCSVLVVRVPLGNTRHIEKAEEPDPIHRVLCCTDFSDASEKALQHALSITEECGAETTLIHVLDEVAEAPSTVEKTAQARQRLEQLVSSAPHKKGKIDYTVRFGRAYEQIIQVATEIDADMAIMGVRGRNALDMAVFGSTTYRVIQLGPCPVLVVPS